VHVHLNAFARLSVYFSDTCNLGQLGSTPEESLTSCGKFEIYLKLSFTLFPSAFFVYNVWADWTTYLHVMTQQNLQLPLDLSWMGRRRQTCMQSAMRTWIMRVSTSLFIL